jgi:hypothetical protein
MTNFPCPLTFLWQVILAVPKHTPRHPACPVIPVSKPVPVPRQNPQSSGSFPRRASWED